MTRKSLLTVLFVPLFILLIPLLAMLFTAEVAWGAGDFLIAWVLMAGTGFAYKAVTSRAGSVAYRVATALALGASFMLIWINLAVGLIGSEDNPANLMYGGVLAIALLGAAIARFEPSGMARAMLVTALAQFLVPIVAAVVWRPDFSPGLVKVFGFNFVFVLLFAGAAILFQHAGTKDGANVQAPA